jgi:hypothetical protein
MPLCHLPKLGGKHRFVVWLHTLQLSVVANNQATSIQQPVSFVRVLSSCSIVTMHAWLWSVGEERLPVVGQLRTSFASLSTDETKRGATTNKLSRGDHPGRRPPAAEELLPFLTTPLSFATYYYYVAFCPHIATGINER